MTQIPPVKLRQLEYFLAVAKTLHFSRAAEALFVTQPTLSHQIAELETQLGATLFDRSGKLVQLTEAGRIFADYARRALGELEAGCNALTELDGLMRGTLRIGVVQSFVRKMMPPILGEFVVRYPRIKLQVDQMTASQIEHQLADGSVDLGIAFAPSVLEDTEIEPLGDERLLLVTGRRHRLAAKRTLKMADLSGEPLALLRREYSTRQLIERYFEQAGAQPRVVCEANETELLLGIARHSDIGTIVPEGAIVRTAEIHVVALVEPVPTRVSALLWARHHLKTAAARACAQLVRQRFATHLPLESSLARRLAD